MNNALFVRKLKRLSACEEAVDWVKKHGGTSAECWHDCVHGDWMAWLAAKTKTVTRRQLVGALADCAALSLKYYDEEYPNDKRVRECINTCRRYEQGEATDKELKEAYYATYAAHAAAYSAYSAYSAAAASAAARAKTLKKCADIFRKHFPELLK